MFAKRRMPETQVPTSLHDAIVDTVLCAAAMKIMAGRMVLEITIVSEINVTDSLI